MSKPLDKRVKKILEELEFDPKECLWDCHGTPVMYHKFCEIAGAKRGVEYELYDIERNSEKGIVCIKCVATVTNEYNQQKTSVSTYGEASPKNNKNTYPYAMAEKRAVDRAILKLLGLHGFIYSEDEMDMSQVKIPVKADGTPIPKPTPMEHGKEEYESLNEDDKLAVNEANDLIKEYFTEGTNESKQKAYLIYEAKKDDMRMALWYLLKPQSAIRRVLKQMHDKQTNYGENNE